MPLAVGAGGIDVDGHEDDMVFANLIADLVYPFDTSFERDVFELRYQEFNVVVAILEMRHDGSGDLTRVLIFLEVAIRRALARRFPAVTVVDQDFRIGFHWMQGYLDWCFCIGCG